MQIIESPQEMQNWALEQRCKAGSIGLVPTMGALHEGHLQLVRCAREENERCMVSIFVNPTQFGPSEDFEIYPRPFERDCALLEAEGCDLLFAPPSQAMYPNFHPHSHEAQSVVEVLRLGEMWEGAVRPGHLRGVATIVAKLFNLCAPHRAYFGEKDFQQLRVIEQMVRDLNFPLQIVPVATVRETDGLAMSSRNARLSAEERAQAPTLYRALCEGVALAARGEHDVARLGAAMQQICDAQTLVKLQYLTIVESKNLEPLMQLDERPARILIAASVGETRLIDNVALSIA